MATQRAGLVPQIGIIEDAHEQLGLTYREVADAVQAQESTVHRWRRGDVAPTAVFLGRLNALGDLLSELHRTFANPADAREWLDRSIPALKQRTPRDLVLSGQMDRITGLLYALNAGIPT
jgi:uncharacterized protein (DUF2384 family)